MKNNLLKTSFAFTTALLLGACSVAKLEARLEANPQCKDTINPKTGALMPCPGSDKAFYKEVGLAPAKPTSTVNIPSASTPEIMGTSSTAQAPTGTPTLATPSRSNSVSLQGECKPQIHKKTGGTLPCPAPD